MFAYDHHYARGGNVIVCSSFSKLLGPGLRLGWLQAPVPLLTRLLGTQARSVLVAAYTIVWCLLVQGVPCWTRAVVSTRSPP